MDMSHDDCLVRGTFQMTYALRHLFVTILVFCEVNNIRASMVKHKDSMLEDYTKENSNPTSVVQMALRDLRDLLCFMGKDITSYYLPDLNDIGKYLNDIMTEVREDLNVKINKEHLDIYACFNEEPRTGFDEIIDHV
uniref:Uncharacterized protein n=1 Tax=Oryza brachyantha TaxID=4533 RepID=J3MRH1_ORYBR